MATAAVPPGPFFLSSGGGRRRHSCTGRRSKRSTPPWQASSLCGLAQGRLNAVRAASLSLSLSLATSSCACVFPCRGEEATSGPCEQQCDDEEGRARLECGQQLESTARSIALEHERWCAWWYNRSVSSWCAERDTKCGSQGTLLTTNKATAAWSAAQQTSHGNTPAVAPLTKRTCTWHVRKIFCVAYTYSTAAKNQTGTERFTTTDGDQ